MYFYHIYNLVNKFGIADYKNLNMARNVPGSQIYFANEAVLANTELVDESQDLKIITETEYTEIVSRIDSEAKIKSDAVEDRLANIENILLQQGGII